MSLGSTRSATHLYRKNDEVRTPPKFLTPKQGRAPIFAEVSPLCSIIA